MLADGVELVGEFTESGYRTDPYLVQRADGQVVQLSELLYVALEEIAGGGSYDDVADRVGERYGRGVSADNIRQLEDKLAPLGLLRNPDGSQPQVRRHAGILQLNMRAAVVPEHVVQTISGLLRPLFHPLVVVLALAGLIAVDVWFFFIHGVGDSLRETLYEPSVMLLVLGLVIASAAFHESGHAAACRYGGVDPGVMGAGIYLVWPVFYTNVTDSYRLNRGGRLRVDLGGVYFNVLFLLATAGLYFATRFEPLLLVVLVQHLEMLRQFMPFVRLDGYYVVSDLTGVPDLFARMKPILTSMLPGREPDERVRQLNPGVRVAVTAWVLIVIPVLAFNVVIILINLPRIVATTWDSLLLQAERFTTALGDGAALALAAAALSTVLLVLPLLGITYLLARVTRKIAVGTWRQVPEQPAARGAVAAAAVAALAVTAFTVWPRGDYRPFQEGEQLTIHDVTTMVRDVPSGRPALTEQRAQELDGAPFRSRSEHAEEHEETPAPHEEKNPAGEQPAEEDASEEPTEEDPAGKDSAGEDSGDGQSGQDDSDTAETTTATSSPSPSPSPTSDQTTE